MTNNQELREKVIKGLKCCMTNGHCYYIEKCPYRNETEGCKYVLNRDALTLLEEQEPHVLKLKELKEGMLVWLERSQFVEIHPVEIVSVKIGINYFDQKIMKVDFSEPWSEECTDIPPGNRYEDYNVSWRCWSNKPSKELRNSIKLKCDDENDDDDDNDE